ncbi:MAG: hypothetical protein GY941_17910 [Planctomycetes bacterium]|nr:hypothetical protein [Planctomycetota bacterium]
MMSFKLNLVFQEMETPEDIECGEDVMLFDGYDYSIDYVDIDADTGVYYFANGANHITHYAYIKCNED